MFVIHHCGSCFNQQDRNNQLPWQRGWIRSRGQAQWWRLQILHLVWHRLWVCVSWLGSGPTFLIPACNSVLYHFIFWISAPLFTGLSTKLLKTLQFVQSEQKNSVKTSHCGFMGVMWLLTISWPGAVTLWSFCWLSGNLVATTKLQEVTVPGWQIVKHITPCKTTMCQESK